MCPLNGDTCPEPPFSADASPEIAGVEASSVSRTTTVVAGCERLLGSSPGMESVRRSLECACGVGEPVLIVGEIGTGRTLVGRMLHRRRTRGEEPLLELSCGATPRPQFEAAWLDRSVDRVTQRQAVGASTAGSSGMPAVLLEEIDMLPAEMQSQLVHILDRDARDCSSKRRLSVIACGRADLDQDVDRGSFRLDLLHRLNTLVIRLPPLVARGHADFEELLLAFAAEQPRRLRFTRAAVDWLFERPWPANVRELRNVVTRLAILSKTDTVDVAALQELAPPMATQAGRRAIVDLVDAVFADPAPAGGRLRALESAVIERALQLTKTDAAAARLLGLQRRAMLRLRARAAAGGAAIARGGS